MARYKLILTDEDGVLVNMWTIGTELDFDVEDLKAEGECDSYITEEDFRAGRECDNDFNVTREIAINEGWNK